MIPDLPDEVEKRLKYLGDVGTHWLDQLPATLARLSEEWQISLQSVLHGGSESLVMRVLQKEQQTQNGNSDAVLKVLLPSIAEPGQNEIWPNREIDVLQTAGGCGYVQLLAADIQSLAMLLEPLGAPLGQLEIDVEYQQQLLCETLKECWRTPVADLGLQTGAQKARWLRGFIGSLAQSQKGHISEQALSIAIEFTHEREAAHAGAKKVLVHGDPHEMNILQQLKRGTTEPSGYKMIDPDGLYAEAEYDVGVILRDASATLLKTSTHAPIERGITRCERLAKLSGTQCLPIWQWGYIERVSTGLYTLELGMPEYGKDALAVANSWATQNAAACFRA